ncbi:MAG: SigE family RNA polymerase sigma factor [Ornithinimicrobium sp.]
MTNERTSPGFREFVLGRSDALFRTAALLTRNTHDAQDLLQDALARTWRSWSKIEGAPESYCRSILVRQYISSRRRRWHGEKATEKLPDEPVHDRSGRPLPDPGAAVPGSVVLADAIAALPPRQRAVIVLRYFHDYTEAQTAEAMNIAVGTVKSQHTKALAALRISEHLTDSGDGVAATEGRGQR